MGPVSRALLPCPACAALPCSLRPAALQPMHRAALPSGPRDALPCSSQATPPCPAAQCVAPCCPVQRAPHCPARRALLQPVCRALLPHASRPPAAHASRSAPPCVALCCSPHVAPCCPARRALLQPVRRALLLHASRPTAAHASCSAAPRVALCCPGRHALLPCTARALLPCPPRTLPCSPRRALPCSAALPSLAEPGSPARAALPNPSRAALPRSPAQPSRPAATTAVAAARATAAAGRGASGSAGGAAGAGGAASAGGAAGARGVGGATGSAGGAASAGGAGPTTDRHCLSWPLSRQLKWLGVDSSGHCLSWTTPPLSSFVSGLFSEPVQVVEALVFCAAALGARESAVALGASESAAGPGASESAAAHGASESTIAPGASESAAALGARASTTTGPASAEALHTFTLDSGASRYFFRDCTTLTPLAAPVPVSLADPTGGPVVARALLCPPVSSSPLRFSVRSPPPHVLDELGEQRCHLGCLSLYLYSWRAAFGDLMYTLTTTSAQVAASSQVYASSQLAASCSCRILSHQTLLWHHRLGHPSLPRLCSMHSRLLRAAPHSSEFPPTTAPLQTLHMDVWGPAPVGGTDQERYFLLVVDNYTRYTTVFPLRHKADVSGVLIPWIHATRCQLRERFRRDLPVLRLHSDRGGEFSSGLLEEFCRDEGICQTFTLPASPQQNGIAERRIGLIMEVARTSMIQANASHFLWSFAVRYAAHQLNLWPRVSEPEASPTLRWMGKVGDASVFRVWGALSLVRDAKASKLSSRTLRCVFLGFPTDAPPWQFYHPREHRVFSSQDVTFDESVCFYRLHPHASHPPAAADSGDETAGAEPGGAETEGEGYGGAEPGGAATGGAGSGGAGTCCADSRGVASPSGGGGVGDPHGGPGAGQPPQPDLLETLLPPASSGGAGGTKGVAGAGGTGAASLGGTGGAVGAGGAGPTSLGGKAGAGGARAAGTGGAGAARAGGTGGARAAGPGGARTGGAGAAKAGGGAGAGGAGGTGAAGTGGAGAIGAGAAGAAGSGGARTSGTGAAGADGAARAGGATGAAGTGGAGATGARGAGAGGNGGAGAAGPGGACTRGAGAAEAGGAGGAGGATGAAGTRGAGGTAGAGSAGAGGTGGIGGAGAASPGGARIRVAGAAELGGAAGAGGATGAAGAGGAGAAGAGGAGAAGTAPRRLIFYPQPQSTLQLPDSPQLLLGSPLPAPAPHNEVTESLTERLEPETRASTSVRARRVARPPAVPDTHDMALRPSSVPQRVVLPEPPASSIRTFLTLTFALVTELVDSAARSCLDYIASLVTESESVCPPSVRGEPALSSDVLEDRHFELECLAAALPRFASMLLCLEGDPDALDIPTRRSYAEGIAGEYSSQWQTAMHAEMASWKSTGTYIDEVPPPGANIVDGMWIFRVKRPSGSPPAFKAHYVARGFSQQQGVEFFHTFSPTPNMTTLRVLPHVAAQRDYELHSLDFSTAFLQGSLHEEIWLRRPPGFTGTTLAALGFAPSSADPSLFLRTDTTLPPFYVLVYVDDLVFATADTEALALLKAELHDRHTCTDLDELRSYLGLQITRDRARRTITLTQSHMVHQVLQRFGFHFSSPQATPLSTGHSLSAPPSDEYVEPSGLYLELVACLMYLMTTSGMELVLGGQGSMVIIGHSDASWADDQATQRSSQGCTFSLGSGAVSWRSTRSSSVLGSSCEAEIYDGAMAA
ncbi:unnamed protein product [Closterium sp. NIES-53]